jgi:hypothetical protein
LFAVRAELLSGGGVAGFGFGCQNLVRGVFECLCFGQEGQRLLNHRIPVSAHAEALQLARRDGDDLVLDRHLDPVAHAVDVGIGKGDALAGQILLELIHDACIDLKILVDIVIGDVDRCEVEEDIFVEQGVLEVIALRAVDLFVGSDAAAAVDGAS